jgi:hypothetical protein
LEKIMSEKTANDKTPLVSIRLIVVALIFGGVALVIVVAGLHLPIPGTGVVTDPRELFTTIGSALTGPIGGVIIGTMAGIMEPDGIGAASILAHVAGCLWMGFTYKKLVYGRPQFAVRLLVIAYYMIVVIPGFVIGIALFYPAYYTEGFGDISLFQAYLALAGGAIPETIFTTVATTLVMIALPRKYQKPLW